MTGNLAIIPVKGLVESKSRLARSLSPEDKEKLILALLEDVLAAVKESQLFSRVLVVSPDPNVEKEANLPHGTFLHQEGQGLNAGIRQSTLFAMREKASSVAAAQKTGFAVYSISNPRLSFDVDTLEDLIALARKDPHGKTRTAKCLQEMTLLHVLARSSK